LNPSVELNTKIPIGDFSMFYNRTLKAHNYEWRSELPAHQEFGHHHHFNSHQRDWEVPCADVLELDDQFILELALPGVVLDDIEVKVEYNYLTVLAKRTPTMFQERATYLMKELPTTYMIREFEFHTDILPEQIEARLDRGLLFVSVPKAETALRIPVSAGTIDASMTYKNRAHKTEIRSAKEVLVK
jgi:HSP20 family protein